ncbi:hypothetical protein VPHD148_0275 [Vibrio phage D148]
MQELIQGFKETLTDGMDKVASAYDIPEDQYSDFIEACGVELERSLSVNGLDKEASFGRDFAGAFGGEAVGKAALGLGMGALGGLGAMAVKKVSKGFGASSNRAGYDTALQKAISSSEVLQNDPQKAKMMGDSIFGFAPTVAQDANVLRNILDNSIYGDSIDLQTIKAVTELEEKLKKSQ